jgi:DNA topoisomerase VI subunit B
MRDKSLDYETRRAARLAEKARIEAWAKEKVAETIKSIQDEHIDQNMREAMRRLVEYLENERKHYEDTPEAERHGHIYESVITVRDWLNRAELSHV